jgi:hypothetical protein
MRLELVDTWLAQLAGPSGRMVAAIFATVDSDRAVRDLAGQTGEPVQDSLLGAQVRLVTGQGGPDDGVTVAVAEPTTEGRLAATLARHGEGFAGNYAVAPGPLDEIARRAAERGVAVSRPGDGPFGRSILVLSGPVTGPHLILVEAAAVPSAR